MGAPKGHPPYAGCEKGGRPRKYDDDFIINEANQFLIWMGKPESVWYECFAIERGYNPHLLSEWAKHNKKFATVYEYAQGWQKAKLINGGLTGKYNSNVLKLVLANTIGWTDKQQISGNAANPLAFLLEQANGKSKDIVTNDKRSGDST
jgi:hypothetical protein